MLITVTASFEAGHRLPQHDGLCRRLHGHSYSVELTVEGNLCSERASPTEGMVVDFGVIKSMLREIVARFDHKMLLSDQDPYAKELQHYPGVELVKFVPTAENIAVHVGSLVEMTLAQQDPEIRVHSVRVSETRTSWAEWRPGEV
jgi:6-pyruvoyltetrahydropterin/6-carboxytetrahydropterin synthase